MHYDTAHHYSPSASSIEVPVDGKLDLLRRADIAARDYDSSIQRVDISIVDEMKHIAIYTSDGRMTGDAQPLVRFNVSCLSENESGRQTARNGGGGRMGMAYFDMHTPEDIARDVARQAVLLQSAAEAPAGTFPVVLAAGDSGILLHEAIGHGLEADFNRKKTTCNRMPGVSRGQHDGEGTRQHFGRQLQQHRLAAQSERMCSGVCMSK